MVASGSGLAGLSDQAFCSLHFSPFAQEKMQFFISCQAIQWRLLPAALTGPRNPHAETERLWPWCCQKCHFCLARPSTFMPTNWLAPAVDIQISPASRSHCRGIQERLAKTT
jgi:hypothetical protein